MDFEYFDTHSHTNSSPMCNELETIVESAKKNKLGWICIGTNLSDSKTAIEQHLKYLDIIFATIAIHPLELNEKTIDEDIEQLKKICVENKDKIVAIGETGLDLHHPEKSPNIDLQKKLFIEHIKIANSLDLPLVVHIRDCFDISLDILEQFCKKDLKVIIHCFGGNEYWLEKIKSLGYYVSFAGNVTFKKAFELKNCLKKVNIEKLILETDGPFLSPEPVRGQINYPTNVIHIYEYAAKELKISLDILKPKLISNIKKIFNF